MAGMLVKHKPIAWLDCSKNFSDFLPKHMFRAGTLRLNPRVRIKKNEEPFVLQSVYLFEQTFEVFCWGVASCLGGFAVDHKEFLEHENAQICGLG